MHSTFSRLRPALLGLLLLAPAAQAVELLGVAPGSKRAEAARQLAQHFPPIEQLQARLEAGQRLSRVQPFDADGCTGQPLCLGGWSLLDADGRVQRSEAVQVAIRKEQVMGLRHQSLQRAGSQCAGELQTLRARWQQSYGAAAEEKSTTRNGAQYLLQQWGECPAAGMEAPAHKGICVAASSGCSDSGELDSEISLTDYGRLRQ